MSSVPQVRSISAQEARPLRTAILRPRLPPGSHSFPGDEADETYHVGAFLEDELVGVASVFRERPPFESGPNAWRLRGMAVAEKARRRGCGKALLQACLDYVARQGGELLWCHGRTSALPFYQALGFRAHGEAFDVPASGPHYVMQRPVKTPEREWS